MVIKLMGMGNPLLDISTNVNLDFVKKYDGKFGEATLATEKTLPVFPEIKSHDDVSFTAGGATLNVFRVYAWMSQDGDKPTSAYTGCVGNDEDGKAIDQNATQDGIEIHFQHSTKNTPTGNCAVLVVGKERTLIANIAAAEDFQLETFQNDKALTKSMEEANFYYISGFFLTVSVPSMLRVAKHACENNKVFSMNISAPFLCQFFKDQMLTVMPYVDLLFGNEDEASAIAAMLEYDTKDNVEIATRLVKLEKINKKRNRIVVITQGSQPTIVATLEGDKVVVNQYPVTLIEKSAIVDTNGAGDSFCGGFLSQLVDGKTNAQCVKAGQFAASYIIQKSGVQFDGPPKFE